MNRHGFDPISFVIGTLITIVGIAFASGVHGAGWVPPVLLIGVGLIFVVAAIQRTGSSTN